MESELGPHAGFALATAGSSWAAARLAVILVHGRGAPTGDMLWLAGQLDVAGVTYVAPQAIGDVWYPQRFMAPLEANEPWLSGALGVIAEVSRRCAAAGLDTSRQVLAGFSQGACLVLEYAFRHPARYAAVVGFTGGLIGPDDLPRTPRGSLDGTPILLGASDVDPHIPLARVESAARALTASGAVVDLRVYPGMGHTINPDEVDAMRALVIAASEFQPVSRDPREGSAPRP